ncbi:hypothetical protein E2C01_089855 [Portunus trituberculatus]|uniref:Uncharacterized protein n=1 Tax=Portunus trituberculatus TaxID=210409 RepID=A0A5B7JK86_PORTR|nr:hypothetical protein [Portunus trituberculatus]
MISDSQITVLIEYEQIRVDCLKESPEHFDSYIKSKTVCQPSVGPLRSASGIMNLWQNV